MKTGNDICDICGKRNKEHSYTELIDCINRSKYQNP